jgi:anti-sigma factor RsiW
VSDFLVNHDDAAALKMTERYILGELSDVDSAEFEEHFFGCTECAEDVRQAHRLVETLKVENLKVENLKATQPETE